MWYQEQNNFLLRYDAYSVFWDKTDFSRKKKGFFRKDMLWCGQIQFDHDM